MERGKRHGESDFYTSDPKRRRYEGTWTGGRDERAIGNGSSSRSVRPAPPSEFEEEKILGAEAEGSPCVSLLLPNPRALSASVLFLIISTFHC